MIALSKDPQEKALTAKVDIKPTSAPPMISSTISTTKVYSESVNNMHTVVLNNPSDIVCRYEMSIHYLELHANLMFV